MGMPRPLFPPKWDNTHTFFPKNDATPTYRMPRPLFSKRMPRPLFFLRGCHAHLANATPTFSLKWYNTPTFSKNDKPRLLFGCHAHFSLSGCHAHPSAYLKDSKVRKQVTLSKGNLKILVKKSKCHGHTNLVRSISQGPCSFSR